MDHQREVLKSLCINGFKAFLFLFQCTQNEIRSNPVVTVDFCRRKHCLIFKAHNVIIQLKSLRLYILFHAALGLTEGCVLYKAENRAEENPLPGHFYITPKSLSI